MGRDRDAVRERLLIDRERVLRRIDGLTREIDDMVEQVQHDPPDDEHDPDGATLGFERAQARALGAQAASTLDAIDAALDRLEEGTYGRCLRCDEPIGPDRLDARPAVATCIACAGGGHRSHASLRP